MTQEALKHVWLTGTTASEHNVLPEIRAMMAKARLRRGIEIIKLANRIEQLKVRQDDEDFTTSDEDSGTASGEKDSKSNNSATLSRADPKADASGKPSQRISKAARGAIMREVVLAKVREMKQEKEMTQMQNDATSKSTPSPSS